MLNLLLRLFIGRQRGVHKEEVLVIGGVEPMLAGGGGLCGVEVVGAADFGVCELQCLCVHEVAGNEEICDLVDGVSRCMAGGVAGYYVAENGIAVLE